MSEQEREMIEQIKQLPPALQEKFLERLEGALMAMDAMAQKQKP